VVLQVRSAEMAKPKKSKTAKTSIPPKKMMTPPKGMPGSSGCKNK
jgi:hypothetical protein